MNTIINFYSSLISLLIILSPILLPTIFLINYFKNNKNNLPKIPKPKKTIKKEKNREKIKEDDYLNSTYYKITQKSFTEVKSNSGSYGEYLIYEKLKELEKKDSKFLFNLYIPYGENKTIEIDVLLIHSNGLFVFESKNYSGWIFGDEYSKKWTQVLTQGKGVESRKEQFYNPIFQNKSHIGCLIKYLNAKVPIYSVIVFSDRCKFKTPIKYSHKAYIINLKEINDVIRFISDNRKTVLNKENIEEIYNLLYPLTQTGKDIKENHVRKIEEKIKEKETETETQI